MKKENKYISIALIFAVVGIVLSSCNDSITPPPPTVEPDTTSHNIIW